MKKLFPLILALLLMLSACGTTSEPVYTVDIADGHFIVDTQNMTISDGIHTYVFATNGNTTTITYPNGATYYWSWSGNVGHGGWSEDYDDDTYVDGDTLLEILERGHPGNQKRERSGNPLLGLLAICLGIWNTFWPYSSWFFSHGWYYKDAEPSNTALAMTRFGGIASIIIGIILILI